MTMDTLNIGYIPLVDAAPFIVAYELGFAHEEGIELTLQAAPSWSTLRDMLAFGQIQGAHMLSPVPVASAMGLMAGLPKLNTLMVTSANGNVFGVSNEIASLMAAAGFTFDLSDAKAAGQAIAALDRPLRIGVPFDLSMHAELVSYWLSSFGMEAEQDFHIQAVPPSMMAAAIDNKELDAFCVGEPWGSVTVEKAAGALVLPGSAIWNSAPEKVLAAREDWVDENPHSVRRLMRAVWRACSWLSNANNKTMAAELLSGSLYLDLDSEIVDRALTGRFIVNKEGDLRSVSNFLLFESDGVSFPWKSQGLWIADRLKRRFRAQADIDLDVAAGVFRSDLYRQNLVQIGAEMPLSSSKLEGALQTATEVPTISGSMILGPNRFFNDKIYDPSA